MQDQQIQVLCPVCNSKDMRHRYTKVSQKDGKQYKIFACAQCTGAFAFPMPTEEYLSLIYASPDTSSNDSLAEYELAVESEKSYPNSTVDAQRITERLCSLGVSGSVLDVGSGYGFFSNALLEAGFDVEGIELRETSRKIYKRITGNEASNLAFNSEFARNNGQKFDAVLLSQVLEHLPMSSNPISNIHKILTNNGICIVAVPHFRSFLSVMQGSGDMFITPPEHINYFTIKCLTQAFESVGFRTVHVETVSRYDYRKLKRRFGLASILPVKVLKLFFFLSDYVNRGMYINAYFRKISGQSRAQA